MTYCGSRTLSRSILHVIRKFRIRTRDEHRHFAERMFSRYLWSKKNDKKKDKEVTLCAGACAVTVRRSALLQHSGVFRRMAENGELKKTKEVKLKGVTPTALRKIVQYIREESVYFQNHREAMETLRAACLYQVPAVNDICSNFLITVIDAENACDVLEFSAAHSFPLVEYHCLQFVDRHASEVLRSASFLDLGRTTASDVLRRHSLAVRSEMDVFRAAVGWARHDCVRRGADEISQKEIQEVFKSAGPLLGHVRFAVLSDEELSDPEVDRVHKMVASSEDPKRRSWPMNPETRSRSGTQDTMCFRPREYVRDYGYDLEVMKCDEHRSAKNGESFRARIEVLKGRVFLTGIALAFDRSSVGSKGTSCLYLAASATNAQTSEQKSARGTFLSTSDEDPVLRFPSPLVVRESESVEVALQVKRAVNICSMVMRRDVQIAMPETREVAIKILPSSERSMFRGIKYFF